MGGFVGPRTVTKMVMMMVVVVVGEGVVESDVGGE